MNRREAVIGIGAWALSACVEPTVPEILPPASISIYVHSGWASPRPEYGKVPGTQCPSEYPWKAMKNQDRIPALGEYDESDPAITDYRLGLMQYAGISAAIYQVEMAA